MFKKEKTRTAGLSKEKKWEYVGKPVLIIFGTLNIFILVFFLIYFYT